MIKNEDGTYEYHLPHIQNSLIKDGHNCFMESEIYHDLQYQNRWVKKGLDGDEYEIFPKALLLAKGSSTTPFVLRANVRFKGIAPIAWWLDSPTC